jgi:uncharacterized repeat protein (TIGR01451 family)
MILYLEDYVYEKTGYTLAMGYYWRGSFKSACQIFHHKIRGRRKMHRFIILAVVILMLTLVPTVQAAPSIVIVDDGAGDNVGSYTSLALDANGYPVISYYDISNGDLKVTHCNDPDCIGNDESIVTVDGVGVNVGQYTSLALDTNGYPVISYYDADNDDLKLAHCTDANCTAANIVTVDDGGPLPLNDNVGQYTSLALDANGYPVISYYDADNDDLKLAHCTNANCTAANIVVVDAPGNVGRFTSLVLDGGNPVISYYADTNGNMKVARCNDPVCDGVGESIEIVDALDNTGFTTSVALDGAGNPIISYYDTTSDDLKVAHCNDNDCTGGDESIEIVDDGGPLPLNDDVGRYTSLALYGAGNNPVIAYYDGTNGNLKLTHCNDADCTGADESIVAVDIAGDVGQYTSMVLDANGYPVISYYADSGGDLKVVHCDTPYCVPILTIDDVTVNENAGLATFTLSLGTTGNFPVDITYTTTDNSATAPNDYTTTTNTITIPANTLTITFDVPIIDDTDYEGVEQFFVDIISATNAFIGDNQGVGTINDNERPPRTGSDSGTGSVSASSTSVFDPAISKLGFLLPGQVGVTGEQLEWVVTVSNPSSIAGKNVVITDTLDARLHIDSVSAPGAEFDIVGQTVSVTYATLDVNQSVQFSIFTTVLESTTIFNTACVDADNQTAAECATSSLIAELPHTGETPIYRSLLLWGATLLVVSMAVLITKWQRQ